MYITIFAGILIASAAIAIAAYEDMRSRLIHKAVILIPLPIVASLAVLTAFMLPVLGIGFLILSVFAFIAVYKVRKKVALADNLAFLTLCLAMPFVAIIAFGMQTAINEMWRKLTSKKALPGIFTMALGWAVALALIYPYIATL